MKTGLLDKNGKEMRIGDKVKLILDDGEERIFDVCYKTVERWVTCHPDFVEKYAKVSITGVVFCWKGYDLFPCVDSEGIPDNRKMEVVEEAQGENEAEWIDTEEQDEAFGDLFKCSRCGAEQIGKSGFCPECGAEMKNGKED